MFLSVEPKSGKSLAVRSHGNAAKRGAVAGGVIHRLDVVIPCSEDGTAYAYQCAALFYG